MGPAAKSDYYNDEFEVL